MGTKKTSAVGTAWDLAVEEFEFQMMSKRRLKTIRQYDCEIVAVTEDTPLGCVQLHQYEGEGDSKAFGPSWLLVSILGGKKVALPFGEGADYTCRRLEPDPHCYGKWYPFSVLGGYGDEQYPEGNKPGSVQKNDRLWKLRCYAPDGTLTWVPIPTDFDDADDHLWSGRTSEPCL